MTEDDSEKMEHAKNRSPPLKRRETLQAIGGLGVTGIGLRFGTTDDKVEIPVVVRGDEVLDTTTVPRDWYDHVQVANNVRERLGRNYRSQSWYNHIGQGAADDRINGLLKHEITIYATDPEVARDEVPVRVNGIDISVAEPEERHLDDHLDTTCDEETASYNCVPGGSYLTEENYCFSATSIVEHNDEFYLMTSAHPYVYDDEDECGKNITDISTYTGENPDWSDEIGEVATYNHDYDVALIDQSGYVDGIDNSIVGESYDVIGAVSESYVDTLISDNEAVHHMGISTGRTTGSATEKLQDTGGHCQRTEVDTIEVTTDAGGGDSGGPHYWINDKYDYIAILSVHQQHTSSGSLHGRSYGPAAYAIQDTLGWNFGAQDPTC